jgi:hypothetical protein
LAFALDNEINKSLVFSFSNWRAKQKSVNQRRIKSSYGLNVTAVGLGKANFHAAAVEFSPIAMEFCGLKTISFKQACCGARTVRSGWRKLPRFARLHPRMR